MSDQIYIGNFAKGMKKDKLPFNIDNDAFPTLFNFYVWRGRAKRKRGTSGLDRLNIKVQSVAAAPKSWEYGPISYNTAEYANLFQFLGLDPTYTDTQITFISQATQAVVFLTGNPFQVGDVISINGVLGMTEINGGYYTVVAVDLGLNQVTINVNSTGFGVYAPSFGSAYLVASTSSSTYISSPAIVPGSISLVTGGQTYTESSTITGNLVGSGGGTGYVIYSTGTVFISGGAGTITGTFKYYTDLPVMGLRDLDTSSGSLYPTSLAFDTKYSYQNNNRLYYNVNFYVGGNPFTWSGQDYQQFWTTNASRSLWASNNVPGLHVLAATYTAGSGTTDITFNFTLNGFAYSSLVVGDILWFNEWSGVGVTINAITGVIITDLGAGAFVVRFTNAQTVSGTGIVQVLTNSVPQATNYDPGPPVVSSPQDGIKFYTGDPTSTTGLPPNVSTGLGWVNFAPPLTLYPNTVSINNVTPGVYYLVGALQIVEFKDRLLFFSPWIQTSNGTPIQLVDTVIWSWNGTPYYQVSDSSNTSTSTIVPSKETANPKAYYVNQTGLGGWQSAGISQPIITVNNNEDVLMVGFGGNGRKTRFVYTGNDLQPFLFFNINAELPSSATFSAVSLDRGVIDIGQYGIAMTDQQSSQRIDLDIPDNVFQIQALNNGVQRVNAIRDFFREWIYFSYPLNNSQWKFPTNTFLYNYRDNTWSVLYENWTAHGNFRPTSKRSWLNTGFASWNTWRQPWNSGSGSPQFANIIAGNPQGYVLILGESTGEAPSGYISGIQNRLGNTQITSYNHCVTSSNPTTANPDYLLIQNMVSGRYFDISGIDLGVFTVIHATGLDFEVGDKVLIQGVVGTTQLNGNVYDVIAAAPNVCTIDVDSTSFTPYVSGGEIIYFFSMNNQIGAVIDVIDKNNFVIDLPFEGFNDYRGLGTYTRLSQPLIQTKQFPMYWEQGRQVILKAQKYLLDHTTNAQVTLNIYLSQDPIDVWNNPDTNVPPNGLIYSQILYTCKEATNIGLTPANVNLQMPISYENAQKQIWHRMNTSMTGDSFQLGITLSDEQMRNLTYATSEITLHGIHITCDRGPLLA